MDLFGYRLYRGNSAAFVPDPGNLIAAPTTIDYTDAVTGYFYKLSAVDVHGNESPRTLLSSQQTTDVGDGALPVLSLTMASSNPARSRVQLRYSLPRAGEARLTVHDVLGRRVRVLETGVRPAGNSSIQWDGRDGAGRVAESGTYFVRLDANGRSVGQRCVLLHSVGVGAGRASRKLFEEKCGERPSFRYPFVE